MRIGSIRWGEIDIFQCAMTHEEYYIVGQDTTYSAFVFQFKASTFSELFFAEERFKPMIAPLGEILSIGSEKASINTYQVNKERKGFLPFGKMRFDDKNAGTWVSKYNQTRGWNHLHTDIWIPEKAKALKNYLLPEIVVCVDGGGPDPYHPDLDEFYTRCFSIVIQDVLLSGVTRQKVTTAIARIKRECHDCFYFQFKAPWLKVISSWVASSGGLCHALEYRMADMTGSCFRNRCGDRETGQWKNIFCDESEIIEREVLPP